MPTVAPLAAGSLAGLNFFHNVNQENVLEEHQDSLDSQAGKISALEAKVTALEGTSGGTDSSGN